MAKARNSGLRFWRELDDDQIRFPPTSIAFGRIIVPDQDPFLRVDVPCRASVANEIRTAAMFAHISDTLAGLSHAASLPLPNWRSKHGGSRLVRSRRRSG